MIELEIEMDDMDLRVFSSDITMLGDLGMYEQLYAQLMGWA